MGILALVKVTAVLRMLCQGAYADSLNDNMEMSKQTIIDSFKMFIDAINNLFGHKYLCRPTAANLSRILAA